MIDKTSHYFLAIFNNEALRDYKQYRYASLFEIF